MQDKPKILLVAFDLNPSEGSEAGRASLWLKLASRHFPMLVVTDVAHRASILAEGFRGVEFSFVEMDPRLRRRARRYGGAGYAAAYRLFARSAKRTVEELVGQGKVALIHCLTPASLSSYNDLYRLDVPLVAGPIGGAVGTPRGFGDAFRGERIRSAGRDLYYRLLRKLPGWRRYFEKCTKVIAGSEYVRSLLPLSAQGKCTVIFDAVVDTDEFSPGGVQHDSRALSILFAGRLEATKGVLLLVEAARQLVAMGTTGFRIELAGTGTRAVELQRLIEDYDLSDRVRILGNLPRRAMIEKYRSSDIFCFPSLREAGGNVVLEAMACGLPVVTSDYGGPGHSVADECGIRIPMRGAAAYSRDLASALARLIRDEALRKTMGHAARERAIQHFSRDALETKIVAVYREVLHG